MLRVVTQSIAMLSVIVLIVMDPKLSKQGTTTLSILAFSITPLTIATKNATLGMMALFTVMLSVVISLLG